MEIPSFLTWHGDFSWDFCNPQKTLEAIVMQFFILFFIFFFGGGGGGLNKVHCGLCENNESCDLLSDM